MIFLCLTNLFVLLYLNRKQYCSLLILLAMKDPGNKGDNGDNYAGQTVENASETNSSFSDAVEAGRDAAIDNSISESFNEEWSVPDWYDGPTPNND